MVACEAEVVLCAGSVTFDFGFSVVGMPGTGVSLRAFEFQTSLAASLLGLNESLLHLWLIRIS